MRQDIHPAAIVKQECSFQERKHRLKGMIGKIKKDQDITGAELILWKEQAIQEQQPWFSCLAEIGLDERTARRWMEKAANNGQEEENTGHVSGNLPSASQEPEPEPTAPPPVATSVQKLFCRKCRTTGPVPGCKQCAAEEAARKSPALAAANASDADETNYGEKPPDTDNHGRKKKRKPNKTAEPREDVLDALGNPVPERCRDAFADPSLQELVNTLEFIEEQLEVDPWTTKAGKLTAHYPFVFIDKFGEHSWESKHRLQLALESLRAGIPYAVCPMCKGVIPESNGKCCKVCRGSGHIPQHRWEELQRDAAQSVG